MVLVNTTGTEAQLAGLAVTSHSGDGKIVEGARRG